MTFQKTRENIINFIKQDFPDIDYLNDLEVSNKIESLTWILLRRRDSKVEKIESIKDAYTAPERWK
jgi:hypothetical protein